MAGPWERYSKTQPEAEGPWNRFKESSADAAPAPKGQTVYRTPIGPNPELSGTTFRSAVNDMIHQTPPGSRTFIPENPEVVEGVAPIAIPLGGALTAGTKLGQAGEALAALMGRSAVARTAGSTLAGAASDPEDRMRGAGSGLAAGFGGEALAKGIGAIGGAFSRPTKALKYAMDPVAAQDAAKTAVDGANDSLRASQQAETGRALAGKSYKIDPRQFQGTVPEADNAIRQQMVNRPYPELPSELEIPAEQGEKIRQALDSSINYPKGTAIAIPKEVADQHARFKSLADEIRAQRAKFGGDEANQLFSDWSNNLKESESLSRSARNNPVSAITRPGTDQTALRMRVDQKTGSNLQDLGELLRSAEGIRNPHQLQDYLRGAVTLGKEAVKGGYKGSGSNAAADIDPLVLFLQGKLANSSQK